MNVMIMLIVMTIVNLGFAGLGIYTQYPYFLLDIMILVLLVYTILKKKISEDMLF